MPNLIRTDILLVILVTAGCASTPSGQVFDSPIGEWSETHETRNGGTRSDRLTIIDKSRGVYSSGVLEFYSVEDDRTWKGYWIVDSDLYPACSEKKQGSPYWGEQIFRFNETYTRYTGSWDSCGEGPKFGTRGYR